MIVQCADCKTRFRLEAHLVPKRIVRVRCTSCAYVFAIDGREADAPAPEAPTPTSSVESAAPGTFGEISLESGPVAPAASEPAAPEVSEPAPPEVEASPAASVAPPAEPSMDFEIERSTIPNGGGAPQAPPAAAPEQGIAAPAATLTKPTAAPAGNFTEVDLDKKPDAPAPQEVDPSVKREQDKARRLARALVSDILVYNKDMRDKALSDGNLVQALGPEIKKSWEVYKERVTPEVANSTNHFRDALNDILAEGQPIF